MSTTRALPAAILFDMDGTLVDSEPVWGLVENSIAEDIGGHLTEEDRMRMLGGSMQTIVEAMLAIATKPTTGEYIEYEMNHRMVVRITDECPWRDGAAELLTWAKERGIPCALVSASARIIVEAVAGQAPVADAFAVTITHDDVAETKPHPEGYLKAAEVLGVEIADCLVVEDSYNGLRAGMASGAHVVAVRGIAPVTPSGFSYVRELTDLDEDTIRRLTDGELIDLVGEGE